MKTSWTFPRFCAKRINRRPPRGPFSQQDLGGLRLWRFNRAVPGTNVFFTSRAGGNSAKPYESLNLAYHVGDDAESVSSNRRLLAEVLKLNPNAFTSPRQEHTSIVEVVTEANLGRGATSQGSDGGACDALVTSLRDAPLLLHFADCVPVVLTGRSLDEKPAISVIHAGRRGLMDGIIVNAVRAMSGELRVDPDTITAAIGPSIGPCCYEVDESCASDFARRFGSGSLRGRNLNLREAARNELEAAGVSPVNIFVMETCTVCDHNFFSYRRNGVTGRHSALAWIDTEG